MNAVAIDSLVLILMGDGTKAPVPEGLTPERAIDILREAGLNPVVIQYPDGTEQSLTSEAA